MSDHNTRLTVAEIEIARQEKRIDTLDEAVKSASKAAREVTEAVKLFVQTITNDHNEMKPKVNALWENRIKFSGGYFLAQLMAVGLFNAATLYIAFEMLIKK